VIALIAQAAPLDVNILIQGESGTGKELVARAIHDHSPRRAGPFVSLNCGAMSEGVLESELFGHARGAFTGAVARHHGVFKRADGGTLFLDEVGEMPLGMQTRFLRALETGEFTPVGGAETLRGDIRLVAASNRDLGREVEAGRFRQDLYYRLRVVVIPLPPLRELREDVAALAESFLAQENARLKLGVRGFARPALQALEGHAWPGNVRELRNLISSLVVLKQTGLIEVDDLPPEVRAGGARPGGETLPMVVTRGRDELERELIATTLLELRRDVQEIKALLAGRAEAGRRPAPFGGPVVDTFAEAGEYSPIRVAAADLATLSRGAIEAALRATAGRRRQAAELLGISERTLYRKIKKLGL
jgi:DNA-binding NtrC family response regulator